MRAFDQPVAGRHIVNVPPDAPALLGLAHGAAQRLRDQLMAEADTDHRHLGLVGCAHEVLERGDPLEPVINAGGGAGDEDRLQPFEIRKRLAGGNADGIESDGGGDRAHHPLEHLRIGSVEFAIFGADEPGFDDGNARHRWLSGRLLPPQVPGRDTSVSLLVMNSSSTGTPSWVLAMPRLMAGMMSSGFVTR